MSNLVELDTLPEAPNLELAKSEGPLTFVGDNVKRVADEIDPENKLSGVELIEKVCDFVRTLLPTMEELAQLYESDRSLEFDKRSRSADTILAEDNLIPGRMRARNISGCIETAHVTRALLLAKGIPCLYTETLSEEWCITQGPTYDYLNHDIPAMRGHVFIDAYLEETNTWITVDPNSPDHKIHTYKDYVKNGEKFIYPHSAMDSEDMGYSSNRQFQRAVGKFFRDKKMNNTSLSN